MYIYIFLGSGQILSTARRLYQACQLTAQSRLQEPIFLAEITAPVDAMGGVYQCLNQRRGIVNEEEQVPGTPLNVVSKHLVYFRFVPSSQSLNHLGSRPTSEV